MPMLASAMARAWTSASPMFWLPSLKMTIRFSQSWGKQARASFMAPARFVCSRSTRVSTRPIFCVSSSGGSSTAGSVPNTITPASSVRAGSRCWAIEALM